jgi:hypothetical protein
MKHSIFSAIRPLAGFICLMVLLTACSKNFESINLSPDYVSSPTLSYELSSAELFMMDQTYYTYGDVAALIGQVTEHDTYQSTIQVSSTKDGGFHWDWQYQNPLLAVSDIITNSQKDTANSNYYNMARIIRAYCMQSLTDVYGAIPYSQANKGYTNQVLTPAFDKQDSIYMDMLNELQQAAVALNASRNNPGAADIVFGGDVTKWRKFAYGLMLRMGLRIADVDPANGKKWIAAAMVGGLPQSNSDNFQVQYLQSTTKASGSNPTPNNNAWLWIKYPTKFRLSSPFVDSLRLHHDPRTSAYMMLPGNSKTYVFGDTSLAHQKGYQVFGSDTTGASVNVYSVANIQTYGQFNVPFIHLSYAQVEYELAECTVRGLISTGTSAQTYYENGVHAAMQEIAMFNTSYAISDARVNAYLQQNPYNPATALNQINTQYWIESFPNYYEGWANMRRSGYPDIYSVYNDGTTVLPRRLPYPLDEISSNPHVQDADADQGPDLVTTHLWWDKK